MANVYQYEYTDTFAGEANYSWVKRGTVSVPELTHYGYTGSTDGSYAKANKRQNTQLIRMVKKELGLSGVRGKTEELGGVIEFRPYGMATVLFIEYRDEQ